MSFLKGHEELGPGHCAGDSKKCSISTAERIGRTLSPCSRRPQAMKEFTTRSTHVNGWDHLRKCICLHSAIHVHHPAQ